MIMDELDNAGMATGRGNRCRGRFALLPGDAYDYRAQRAKTRFLFCFSCFALRRFQVFESTTKSERTSCLKQIAVSSFNRLQSVGAHSPPLNRSPLRVMGMPLDTMFPLRRNT